MRQLRRLTGLVLATVTVLGPLLLAQPAAIAAADPGESIPSYAVTLTVREDGSLHVLERITYDFGTNQRHGIVRTLPTTQRYNNRYNRIYQLTNLEVASPTDAPTQTEVTRDSTTVIRIGDPDRTITGVHGYEIEYDLAGAMNDFRDHQELYWNAIGAEWDVPIEVASVTVEMPAAVTRVKCFSDPGGGEQECATSDKDGTTAEFSQESLAAYQPLTVVVGIPAGSVPAKPILQKKRSLAWAFSLNPVSIGGLGAILVLLGGGIAWVLWTRGRDRRYVDQIPGLTPAAGQLGVEEHRPLFTRPDGAVEFAPPDGVRPGQVGTLIDERADVVDVTATIVDLAVRKYIFIEELPAPPGYGGPDWRLSVAGPPDNTLLRYERLILNALFAYGPVVHMSQLRNHFAPTMAHVRSQLYDEVVRQGWFARRPDRSRSRWTTLGILLSIFGFLATSVLTIFTEVALIGVGLMAAGIVLAVGSRYLPARTARGSAVLARVLGFRQYIRVAETAQLKYEEQELILSRYLPYAIVFGETERLARAFATLNAGRPPGTGLYWYSGPGDWDLMTLGSSMGRFTTMSAAILVSTPSPSFDPGFGAIGSGFGSSGIGSSSSGFGSSGFGGGGSSGGGGGGGGGGSW